nr:AraC family transcriptional regulator [Niabella pedocola]
MLFHGETRKKAVKLLSKITEAEGIAKIIDFLKVIDLLTASGEFSALATVLYNNRYDEKDAGRIFTVYQHLLKNFKRDIPLKEVADLCHMTTNSFCRFFKSRTNKPFTRFLNELRIGYACELLQDETQSISAICYECGYNTTANFHKFFKQIQHTTPAGYRKWIQDGQTV